MRVLLLHNRYRAQGGEERAVGEIAGLLSRKGDAVEVLERSSTGAGRVRAARALLSGGIDPDQVTRAIERSSAEVVHAHNVHPLFGWHALAAARDAGVRTVLHLHNFRLFCAIAVAYRDGAPCFRCRGSNTLPGLRLRCRGDLAEAAVYAAALHNQQPHLFANTDRFVVPSSATANRLIELGLPAEKTAVLPNFIPASGFAQRSCAEQGEHALVAGRLVEEKGFDTAIRAARAAGVPLIVAGAGPDEPRLRRLATGGDVQFVGRLGADALAAVRARAAVVLAPSRSEEACPYSVLEALGSGVPVLASDRGGLPELVAEDQVLAPDDVDAWEARLGEYWRSADLRGERGEQALRRARERYGEDRYYDGLREVYGGR